MCENCKKTVPPSPGCAKTARRLVPTAPDVRKLQEDWSPQPGMCENCKKNGPPSPGCSKTARRLVHLLQFSHKPGVCENCKKTGPTSVVAIFERAKTARRLVPPCAKTARTMVHFVRNLARTPVRMFENCKNNGPFCAKSARTPVPHVRKMQEHWRQNVRKVRQGLKYYR